MLRYFKNCEFNRKLIHLISLVIPVICYYFSKPVSIWILLILFSLVVLWEVLRLSVSIPIIKFINKIFMRKNEHNSLSGAFYFTLSSLLAVVLFNKYICVLSLSILVICDTAAAFVGMNYGRYVIFSKTIEGSLAFFFAGLGVIFVVNLIFNYPIINGSAIFALIITTLAELFSKVWKIDDNLLIVLVFGGCYSLFFYC